ncbi:MAG: LysE family translocator [Alphaproteobacteria bacterium]|nr:LysE family translocator [Alphaproteobacteria bacterium]
MPLDPTLYVGYIVAAVLIVIFPGPDTLLILRYTMAGGRRVGFATLGGVQIGILGHITAAVLGLSVLIVSVPVAFKAVAIAGAAYLAFLGVQSLRAGSLRLPVEAQANALVIGHGRAVRDAIITNFLNPKVILLFVALMPNFVAPARASVPLQLALLGVTLIVINVTWQTGLVLAADRLRQWLARLSVQRVMAMITGIVFIAFAALLLVDHVLTDGQWHAGAP